MSVLHNLPAHATKHVEQLHYALPNAQLVLHQDNQSADSTGPSPSSLLACLLALQTATWAVLVPDAPSPACYAGSLQAAPSG